MEGAQEQERHSVVDLIEFVLFSLCNYVSLGTINSVVTVISPQFSHHLS
jgi:hypothetical protein